MAITSLIDARVRPVFSVLHAAQLQQQQEPDAGEIGTLPFITVSRQSGISTDVFTHHLA